MPYIELSIGYQADQDYNEIIIAELANAGFESFQEEPGLVKGYIKSTGFDHSLIDSLGFMSVIKNVNITTHTIEDQNWNAVWESNFEPVIFEGKCLIRAPFHKDDPTFPMQIIIEPKMSFGTAHHPTTALMIETMYSLDIEDKIVLDMGSGTGILAILASKLGAKEVVAIDNDKWAVENSIENVARNNINNITVLLGDAGLLKSEQFDIILANINRNVLLTDMKHYTSVLNQKGSLVLSGFYENDIEIINATARKLGLTLMSKTIKSEWSCLLLTN